MNDLEQVTGNGLLHRRMFLSGNAALPGARFELLSPRPANAVPPDVPARVCDRPRDSR